MITIPRITMTRHGIALRADFAGAFFAPAGLNLAMKLQCKLPVAIKAQFAVSKRYPGDRSSRRSRRCSAPTARPQALEVRPLPPGFDLTPAPSPWQAATAHVQFARSAACREFPNIAGSVR